MHSIRLRRPWAKCIVDSDPNAVADLPAQRVEVPEPRPDTRKHQNTLRTVRYSRNFNRPTGLSESTRVRLKISSWEGTLISLALNSSPLPIGGDKVASDKVDVDITDRLDRSNQFELVLRDTETHEALLSGEVALEIEELD